MNIFYLTTLLFFITIYIICFVYLYDKRTKDSNEYGKRNNNALTQFEIRGYFILTLFHTFFMFFVIQILSSEFSFSNNTWLVMLLWVSIFLSTVLEETALLLYLSALYLQNRLFKIKHNKDSERTIPHKYRKNLSDFKILFIVNWGVKIILLFILLTTNLNRNSGETTTILTRTFRETYNIITTTRMSIISFYQFIMTLGLSYFALNEMAIGSIQIWMSTQFYNFSKSKK